MTTTFIWSIAQMSLVWFGKDSIIDFYTYDTGIKEKIYPCWYILVVFIFFDCMQGVANGNISGLGVISEVKWIATFSYWVVGIPLSLYLMFKLDMELEGLWYGPTAACAINYICYTLKIQSSNWQEIADAHQQKMLKKEEEK